MSNGSPGWTGVANGSGSVRSTVGAGVTVGAAERVGGGADTDGLVDAIEAPGSGEVPGEVPGGCAFEQASTSVDSNMTAGFSTLSTL